MPAQATTSAVAAKVPGTSPATPRQLHDTAQIAQRTRITRVRRRPSIRCRTNSCSRTMTAVLTANARPMVPGETRPTSRAKAVNPASIWA